MLACALWCCDGLRNKQVLQSRMLHIRLNQKIAPSVINVFVFLHAFTKSRFSLLSENLCSPHSIIYKHWNTLWALTNRWHPAEFHRYRSRHERKGETNPQNGVGKIQRIYILEFMAPPSTSLPAFVIVRLETKRRGYVKGAKSTNVLQLFSTFPSLFKTVLICRPTHRQQGKSRKLPGISLVITFLRNWLQQKRIGKWRGQQRKVMWR